MANVVTDEDRFSGIDEEVTICDECGREPDSPYTVATTIDGIGRNDKTSNTATQHLCKDCLDQALTRSAGDRLSEINIEALAESPNRSGIYFNEEYRDLTETVRKELYVMVVLLCHAGLWAGTAIFVPAFPVLFSTVVCALTLLFGVYQCSRIFNHVAGFRSHMR